MPVGGWVIDKIFCLVLLVQADVGHSWSQAKLFSAEVLTGAGRSRMMTSVIVSTWTLSLCALELGIQSSSWL